jgi:DNA-binding NarL/FixJ family response regulator
VKKALRVIVVDDHPIFRQGLRALVTAQPDMEVIGEADDGTTAIEIVGTLRPDVVVLDVSMPETSGLKTAEEVKSRYGDVKIVTLTRHSGGGYMQQLLRAGSDGYVLKQSESEEVLRAIRAVARGQTYVDPVIASQLVAPVRALASEHWIDKGRSLSRREEDVLRMIASGLLNREVADRLRISIKTVESHKANAMNKLELQNRVGIVRYALEQGWLRET